VDDSVELLVNMLWLPQKTITSKFSPQYSFISVSELALLACELKSLVVRTPPLKII